MQEVIKASESYDSLPRPQEKRNTQMVVSALVNATSSFLNEKHIEIRAVGGTVREQSRGSLRKDVYLRLVVINRDLTEEDIEKIKELLKISLQDWKAIGPSTAYFEGSIEYMPLTLEPPDSGRNIEVFFKGPLDTPHSVLYPV